MAVALFCALAFAQTTPPLAPPQPSADISPPAEVLTDTMGVDFGPYLARLVHDVQQQWWKMIPESTSTKRGKVVLQFVIKPDGSVAGLQLVASSGDLGLDRPAYGSITASNPFPPLPSEFKGPYLGLRLTYSYNLSLRPNRIRLATGASQQFSAPPRGTGDDAVEWSVSGKNCGGTVCGTVSDRGLYRAPDTLPDPPVVTVTAKWGADPKKSAEATVTIVKPEEKASGESNSTPKQ